MEILSTIAFVIYVMYICYTITKHGYPKTLSDTYYLYPKWAFPTLMTVIGFMLLPQWLEVTEGNNFQFLSFLACASLIFVGSAPDYKNDIGQYQVHIVCAYLAAAAALLSMVFVCGGWYWILAWLIICWGTDSNFKENYIFHIEDAIIMSVFLSV